jgi:hypothetical protein
MASLGVWPNTVTLPPSGGEQAEQHVDRRRLAGAVRAEQRDGLATRDRQIDAAHGRDGPRGPAVGLLHPDELHADLARAHTGLRFVHGCRGHAAMVAARTQGAVEAYVTDLA